MKKKKLKKRLRKLENQYYRVLAQTRINMNDISHLKKFKDGECCKDDIKDLNNRMDGICMDVNSLRSNIERINGRCDILDRRTQTDYDKIIPKGENNGN